MSCRRLLTSLILIGLLTVLGVCTVLAQQGQQIIQGVYLDAEGIMRSVRLLPRPDLARGKAPVLNDDVRRVSPLRKVSLTRLERALTNALKEGTVLPDEIRYLAGLHRIDYVLVHPGQGEIIVAGPAEGWIVLDDGTALGEKSGATILQLDDLIVALRTFPPGCERGKAVWCSIDATPQGRSRLQQVLAQIGRQINPRQIGQIARTIQQALGPHQVVVGGVPRESGIAFKMVGADYAMKCIAMGVLKPPVRGLRSYVEMAPLTHAGTFRVQRWWFIPQEELVARNEEGTVWKLSQQRVRLVGDSDFQIRVHGERDPFENPDPSNRRFAEQFTRAFEDLKKRVPVLDELENVFDLLTVAVILEYGEAARLAGWDRAGFLDEELYQPGKFPTPQYAETLVSVRIQGTRVTTPVGGAHYRAESVMAPPSEAPPPAPPIEIPDDPSRWWWD